MFEEEAEEYAENRDVCDLLDAISENLQNYDYGTVAHYNIDPLIEECFKDGAEFGYNKAKEWHYMKDGDYPPENVPLNIITFDKDKKKRLWTGEYKGGNGQWWTGYFNHFIDVPYAWKEIELPEEE